MNRLFAILLFCVLASAGKSFALPHCPATGVFDNCFGPYTFDDGAKYVGEWRNDKLHGQGTYTWADGKTYVGEWRTNKQWKGIQYSPSGQVQGTYKNGEWCAGCKPESTASSSSGGVAYCYNPLLRTFSKEVDGGCFSSDKQITKQEYTSKRLNSSGSTTTTSSSSSSSSNGESGSQVFDNGDKYVGEFQNGRLHGQGTYTWVSGDWKGYKYVGEWRDNKQWKGILYSPSGQVQGTYKNGEWCAGCKPESTSTASSSSTTASSSSSSSSSSKIFWCVLPSGISQITREETTLCWEKGGDAFGDKQKAQARYKIKFPVDFDGPIKRSTFTDDEWGEIIWYEKHKDLSKLSMEDRRKYVDDKLTYLFKQLSSSRPHDFNFTFGRYVGHALSTRDYPPGCLYTARIGGENWARIKGCFDTLLKLSRRGEVSIRGNASMSETTNKRFFTTSEEEETIAARQREKDAKVQVELTSARKVCNYVSQTRNLPAALIAYVAREERVNPRSIELFDAQVSQQCFFKAHCCLVFVSHDRGISHGLELCTNMNPGFCF